MKEILNRIDLLQKEYLKPDPKRILEQNLKLGLRNPDGSGVVVGLTRKGRVVGYEKHLPRKHKATDEFLNNLHIPDLPADTHVTPVLASYYVLNGRLPNAKELAQFESKLPYFREFEIKPTQGKLYYCGYDIHALVKGSAKEKRLGFEETAFLLLTERLPTARELQTFKEHLGARRALPIAAHRFLMYESENRDQMSALHRSVSAMSLFDPEPTPAKLRRIALQCIDLIAKIPAIVAYSYQASSITQGQSKGFIPPDPDLSTAENFLLMLHGEKPDRLSARIFDECLMLHAEHGGGNNSTFTVRVVSSSQANTYMAITSGIASLSGHLHGGANEAVLRMTRDIKDNVRDWNDEGEIGRYLERLLKKQAGDKSGKLFGLGHAVYTLSDPRALLLKKRAEKLAQKCGREDEYHLLESISRIGSELIFTEKKKPAAANVDFYSGFIYEMLGIPVELFTPIFAMARIAGWSAHRLEQLCEQRIIRPAYASSDPQEAVYKPLAER